MSVVQNESDGDVSKVGYFLDIAISIADSEFKIKSLYSNDLILNIASKSKETVQKLKFLDSPSPSANVHGCTFADRVSTPKLYLTFSR